MEEYERGTSVCLSWYTCVTFSTSESSSRSNWYFSTTTPRSMVRTEELPGTYKVLAALHSYHIEIQLWYNWTWGNLKKNWQIAGYTTFWEDMFVISWDLVYAIPIFPKKPCGNKSNNAEVTPHDIHIETLLSHIGGNGWTDPSSGTHPCTNREQTWKLVIYGYFQK